MATALQSYNRFNLIYTGFEFVNKTEFNLCEVNINIFVSTFVTAVTVNLRNCYI